MADYVATAGQNTDNAKAQALNNIAQTGQSQSQAFGQAAQNDAAAKTAALKTAMAMAALRGAPTGNVQQGQSTISAPLDQRATTLDTIKGNYAANNANRAQNFGQFFDLTKAGLPIAEQRYKEQAGQLQEKAAERAAALQAQAQARDDAHNLAMMRLAAAQEKASKPQTEGQFINALGGQDLAGDQLNAQANRDYQAQPGFGPLDGGFMGSTEMPLFQPKDFVNNTIEGRGLVDGTPLSPDVALSLMDNSANKDISQSNAQTRGSQITAEQVRNTPKYPEALKQAVGDIAKNLSSGDVIGGLASRYGIPTDAAYVIYQDALRGMTATRSATGAQ